MNVLCNFYKDVKSELQTRDITLKGHKNNFLLISCVSVLTDLVPQLYVSNPLFVIKRGFMGTSTASFDRAERHDGHSTTADNRTHTTNHCRVALLLILGISCRYI